LVGEFEKFERESKTNAGRTSSDENGATSEFVNCYTDCGSESFASRLARVTFSALSVKEGLQSLGIACSSRSRERLRIDH
jgi:hypothetical protein